MNWYGWLLVAFLIFLLFLAMQRRNGGLREYDQIMASVVDRVHRGDFESAHRMLISSLDRLPQASQCSGLAAHQRFNLLALLGSLMEKWTRDPRKHLAPYDECRELIGMIPPPPPGPDLLVNIAYMVEMNRANVLEKLGRYAEATEGYEAALRRARDAAIRCKCLVYVGWAFLCQRNPLNLSRAWESFDKFGQEARGGQATRDDMARFQVGRALQLATQNRIAEALIACDEALYLEPAQHLAATLRPLLVNGPSPGDLLSCFFAALERGPSGTPTPSPPLPPLPADF
jgi:tetratricopeptide (TPR) repeat protein